MLDDSRTRSHDLPTPAPRWRWRIIPAVLSWFVGALALAGFCVGTFFAITILPWSDWTGPMFYPLFAVTVLMPLSGSLSIAAGFLWMRGRWQVGLLFDVIALVFLAMANSTVAALSSSS